MLRFTKRNRKQISNRLAIFASLMLLISALGGMNSTFPNRSTDTRDFAEQETLSMEQSAVSEPANKPVNRNKGFKVSLFLFRLD